MSCNYRVSKDVDSPSLPFPSLPRANGSSGIGNELPTRAPTELGRTREGLSRVEERLGAAAPRSPSALSMPMSSRADPGLA